MGSHNFTCHPTQVNAHVNTRMNERYAPRLNLSQIGRHSIYLPRGNRRLSWPRRLVTCQDGLPARRKSPIQVLTWPGVEQLCWSDTTRYRYARLSFQRSQRLLLVSSVFVLWRDYVMLKRHNGEEILLDCDQSNVLFARYIFSCIFKPLFRFFRLVGAY